MTPLETLARRSGIALSIPDGHGGERPESRETLHGVLAALGVDAPTDARAAESLAALGRQDWQTVVPPVVVAHSGAVVVEVTLPCATRVVSWHIACDDGTQLTGDVAFGDLELVARDDGDSRPGRRRERRRMRLGDVPIGYHQLSVEPQGGVGTVIVTPGRCFLPADAEGGRLWGVALQLYLLKSERNLGLGDFGDLAALAPTLVRRGCDIVGLNPLHAPFPDNPEHASPYSPASRLLLNPLNIDVTAATAQSPAAAALLTAPDAAAEIATYRAADMLRYDGIAALKARVLRAAFAEWRAANVTEADELAAFRTARGPTFARHCLYFALRAHLLGEGSGTGDWRAWPQPYQDSRGAVVARFARTNADDVTWVAWQQWLADKQLAKAAAAAHDMRIGLYRDLAIGADAAGAETWAERELMLHDLRVGAPPDPLAPQGQEWGLPPPNPERLRATAFRSFVDLLRANMRHAGALRIDHVMGLERLYVVPKGAPATDGAYLEYPVAELAGVLALESVRHRCVVVGEDLGLVPAGFRERMAQANVLSYRVLRFERDGSRYRRPDEYPQLAVAVSGNHDLATLRAWWEGADLELAREHDALPAHALEAARHERSVERQSLLDLLQQEGLLPNASVELSYDDLFAAVYALLGRTRALVVLAQLDDILRERSPVNAPGAGRYPSWRRRYSQPVERLADEPLLAAAAASFGVRQGSAA
jgi:4-alpha-glucanotransferase